MGENRMSSQKPLRRCVTGNTEYVTTISIGLSRHGSAVSDSWSRSGQPPGQAEAFEVKFNGWTSMTDTHYRRGTSTGPVQIPSRSAPDYYGGISTGRLWSGSGPPYSSTEIGIARFKFQRYLVRPQIALGDGWAQNVFGDCPQDASDLIVSREDAQSCG